MLSCGNTVEKLVEVQGRQLPIDASLPEVDSIAQFVAPFRKHIDQVLDSPLTYAPEPILLDDGPRNTAMGNLMADIVFEETAPLFKTRTGGMDLDFVALNYGGVRAIISEGPVSARTAYEIMPFENYIVVVELDGTATRKLIDFLSKAEDRHPISGIKIVVDRDGHLESADIQGKPFDEGRHYFVATSDYLVQSGPSVGFFNETVSVTPTGYLLRNAMIDHFGKQDSLVAQVDDRFIQRTK